MASIVGVWITNLAVIAILAALVDMILPNGNMRKYTSFLFGLVILVMFLNPLFQLFRQSSNLESIIFKNTFDQARDSAAYYSSQAEGSYKQNMESFMRESLEKNLAAELTYKTGLNIHDTKIVFDKAYGEFDYSIIQQIDVYVSPLKQQAGIDQVQIDLKDESIKEYSVIDNEKVMEIREMVSDLYQIDSNLVFVYEN
ncbi:MAG: stage III sporulation protein AF [Caldicoprobacterales bacterium]|jgi:stage III sporulation protein AF